MKIAAPILLVFVITTVSPAQPDSLSDIFPLAIGNSWADDFHLYNSYVYAHTVSIDTGRVTITILGSTVAADSTIWRVLRLRHFTRTTFDFSPPGDTLLIDDTSYYDIVELESGRHELYSRPEDWSREFPFRREIPDSSKFFRYAPTDSTGETVLHIRFSVNSSGPPTYDCQLLADTGFRQLSYHTFGGGFSTQASYYLRSFRNVGLEPIVRFSGPSLTLRTLFGRTVDTAITVFNDGIQPLQIRQVSTSDGRFSVLDWPASVGVLSAGRIRLRFNSESADTVVGSLVIVSNAPSSSDTIGLRGEAIAAAVSVFSPQIIQFPDLLGGAVRSAPLGVTNAGNIPLLIDSVVVNPPFSVTAVPGAIAPQASSTIVFTFTAPMRIYVNSVIASIFSNAISSPSKIQLFGSSFPPATIDLHPHQIDFGKVALGGYRDTVISIFNRSEYSPDLIRTPHELIPPFAAVSWTGFGALSAYPYGGEFLDTIRFAPTRRGVFAAVLRYATYYRGFETSVDSVILSGRTPFPAETVLRQSFPNPFNSKTTIRFSIGEAGFYSLRVYDAIGRVVAKLTEGNLAPGDYETGFEGSGVASGVYIYRLQGGGSIRTGTFVVVR